VQATHLPVASAMPARGVSVRVFANSIRPEEVLLAFLFYAEVLARIPG